MRAQFLHLGDTAVETDERIPEDRRSRFPFVPHGHGKSVLHRRPVVARKQFRERLLIGGKRVHAEDAILQEDGVQLAGAVQANEQRRWVVGDRACGGSGEPGTSGRTVRRHDMHGCGEASHSFAIEFFGNHAFRFILHGRWKMGALPIVLPVRVAHKRNSVTPGAGKEMACRESGQRVDVSRREV